MATTVYTVSGMSCNHCVHAVTQEVSALDGVTEVTIELKPEAESLVTVTSNDPLVEDVVRAAVDEAGYELTGVAG